MMISGLMYPEPPAVTFSAKVPPAPTIASMVAPFPAPPPGPTLTMISSFVAVRIAV